MVIQTHGSSEAGLESPSCSNCVGACCRGPQMMNMTAEEAAFLKDAGAKIMDVVRPEDEERTVKIPVMFQPPYGTRSNQPGFWSRPVEFTERKLSAGVGTYRILEDCPYLDTSDGDIFPICTARDDARRPQVCSNFEEGSEGCIGMREAVYGEKLIRGWVPVEIRLSS